MRPDHRLLSPLGKPRRNSRGFGSVQLSPHEPLIIDGYTLRILTAQGDDAPGGAKSYIVNGRMVGGFAILATPIKYGETGIMTFMISREGVVYEQDLGPDTVKIAASIQKYNPDESLVAGRVVLARCRKTGDAKRMRFPFGCFELQLT